MVDVGLPCENRPERHENNPVERFSNRKARYYQNLADAFERGEVAGLRDELTITQLIGVLYEIDSRGRLKIESKAEAAARGVPSSDRAEALMLALGEAPREYAFHCLRDIRDALDPDAAQPASIEATWEANWKAAAERRERKGSGSFGLGRLKKSRRYDGL